MSDLRLGFGIIVEGISSPLPSLRKEYFLKHDTAADHLQDVLERFNVKAERFEGFEMTSFKVDPLESMTLAKRGPTTLKAFSKAVLRLGRFTGAHTYALNEPLRCKHMP